MEVSKWGLMFFVLGRYQANLRWCQEHGLVLEMPLVLTELPVCWGGMAPASSLVLPPREAGPWALGPPGPRGPCGLPGERGPAGLPGPVEPVWPMGPEGPWGPRTPLGPPPPTPAMPLATPPNLLVIHPSQEEPLVSIVFLWDQNSPFHGKKREE